MSKQKQCIDFYGEKLKVGDEVIPILEEALLIGISGVISKIEYSEEYDTHYITIDDKDGNIVLEGVDARCYTTQVRYDERENQKYVYYLTFFDENDWPISSLPLTNRTNPDFEIPDKTYVVEISASHLIEKEKNSERNLGYTIYRFFIDGKVKFFYHEEDTLYLLISSNSVGCFPINSAYRVFKNDEELKKYIKGIIEYFNSADLTHINNDEEFDKNEDGKKFEKKLICYLKN